MVHHLVEEKKIANMRKYIILALSIVILIVYLFLYLGIELELKFVVERMGVKLGQLISTSFKIRAFMAIQLGLFLIVLFTCVYLSLKKKVP